MRLLRRGIGRVATFLFAFWPDSVGALNRAHIPTAIKVVATSCTKVCAINEIQGEWKGRARAR